MTKQSPSTWLQTLVLAVGLALLAAVPALGAVALECEQVAQLDSKDMDAAIWQALARAVAHHLARPAVQGIVITHGTDTLEETAYFLNLVIRTSKPIVVVGSMRPGTALSADGALNLFNAVSVAASKDAAGKAADAVKK